MTNKALFSELLYDSHSERWNEFRFGCFARVSCVLTRDHPTSRDFGI